MPPSIKKLEDTLKKAGFKCRLDRGKGSHRVWVHEKYNCGRGCQE